MSRCRIGRPSAACRTVSDTTVTRTATRRLAGLGPLAGSLQHPYRKKSVNERKNLPDEDVAAAGEWRNAVTVETPTNRPTLRLS